MYELILNWSLALSTYIFVIIRMTDKYSQNANVFDKNVLIFGQNIITGAVKQMRHTQCYFINSVVSTSQFQTEKTIFMIRTLHVIKGSFFNNNDPMVSTFTAWNNNCIGTSISQQQILFSKRKYDNKTCIVSFKSQETLQPNLIRITKCHVFSLDIFYNSW